MKIQRMFIAAGTLLLTASMVNAQTANKPMKTAKPPKGAIILYNGKNTNAWQQMDKSPVKWTILPDGAIEVKPGAGNIITKQEFGDYQLHVEFATPLMPDAHSQERGNSGVYNQGRYEIQVLDSYNNETYKAGGCGSIYGIKDPDKNMAKPPLEWQSYDITFRAPRFDADGKETEYPHISLVWNGEKVHDNVEVKTDVTTSGMTGKVLATGPIMLQDHGCLVRYRNIWIKPLKLK